MSFPAIAIPKLHVDEGIYHGPKDLLARPLSAHIGAQIEGIDLRKDLVPAEVDFIRAMLLQWKVVFFKKQFLSHEQHIRFARYFGELTDGHPVFGSVEGYPEVYSVAKNRHSKRAEGEGLVRPWTGWHTDVTAAVNPPFASILRGVDIPPYGGDTQWTNLAVAYDRLSPTLREFLDGLRGIHQFSAKPGKKATPEYIAMVEAKALVSEHPLVAVHPETKEKVLYVSPSFLKSITGLTLRESQVMLEYLWEHITRQEFTVRFKWEAGSIAFWDNRATCHLPPTDIFSLDYDRQLYRITLVGHVPVGADGRKSVSITGNPVLAAEAANI